ncbi:hypothetical protein COU37_02225 [Candidatus Micrarchaeota archaeon CG10_big_fil_rev_8_21_14_0_10_45_29]|nr:MAG: hypothetical protein COU37_02225 [Candidatus Micrarchaeota archaeon CG10_big_fil_rev_8_21_14_0_10_45_29]
MGIIAVKNLDKPITPKNGKGAFSDEIPKIEGILGRLDFNKNLNLDLRKRLLKNKINGAKLEYFMGALKTDGGIVRISDRAALSVENPIAYTWTKNEYSKHADFRDELSKALEKCEYKRISQNMFVLDENSLTAKNQEDIRLRIEEKKNNVKLGKGAKVLGRCVARLGKCIIILGEAKLKKDRPKDYQNAMQLYGSYEKLVEALEGRFEAEGYMEGVLGTYRKNESVETEKKVRQKLRWNEYVEKIMLIKKDRVKKLINNKFALELEIISNSNSDVRKFEEDYPGGISAIKERMICEGHIQSAEKHVEEIGAVAKNYKREGRGLQFEEKDWTTGDYSDPKDLD